MKSLPHHWLAALVGGSFLASAALGRAEAPAEDVFADATLLPQQVTAHPIPTAHSTLEPGEPPVTQPWQGSVWRRWTAPSAGFWLLKSEGGVAGAGVDVWRDSTLAGLVSAVEASAEGDPPGGGDPLPSVRVVVRAAAGETLRVRVLTSDDLPASLTIKPATPGDMFDQPVDLGAAESASHTRDLADVVTAERGEGPFYTGSQWLMWTCPTEGIYEVEASAPHPPLATGAISGLEPVVVVYRGEFLATLTNVPAIPLGIVSQPRRFRARAGERFVMRAGITPFQGIIAPADAGNEGDSWGWTTLGFGPTSISVSVRLIGAAPAHDDFAAAHDLGSALDQLVNDDNTGASDEPGEPFGTYEAGDSVWHRWTAPAAGRYEYLGGSSAYLTPKIYRGATLNALTLIAAGSNGYGTEPPGHARLRFEAAVDEVFHIRLTGNGYGRQGAYSFRLRQLHPPANDLLAHAITLEGALAASGDTTDAGVEAPLEYRPGAYNDLDAWSSVWWKWTAPESGWFELRGNASLGILENGNRYGYTLASNDGFFRFQAVAGRVYHFRLAHHQEVEGPVALTLDRLPGLEHTTPETALEAAAVLRFSTPLMPVAAGAYHTASGSGSGAQWVRWTPPASGWVSLDTGGSEAGVGLTVFAAEDLATLLAYSHSLYGGAIWPGFDDHAAAWVRPLEDATVRREAALAPEIQRLLLRVTAGQTYYVRAVPYGRSDHPLVRLNARPAAPPPSLDAVRARLRQAHGVSWLEVILTVSTPNGFVEGVLSNSTRFYDAHRIGGNAFAGEYRVELPVSPSEEPYPFQPRIQVWDAAGGDISVLPEPLEIAPLPDQPAEPDRRPPQLDGVLPASSHVVLDGRDVTVTWQLGISDAGGSGFAEGEIYLLSSSPGAPPLQVVRFGPAQRVRGDGALGVYEVTLAIPAATPEGTQARCLLRDAAGNAAGRWSDTYSSVITWPRERWVVPWQADATVVPAGFVTPIFDPVLVLPLTIEQRRPPDLEPPVIHEAVVEYRPDVGTHGEVRLHGRLTDTGSGLAEGRITLVDEHGLIVSRPAFSAAATRVSGTAADGLYDVRFPVPAHGFGGPHWVTWEVRDGAGHLAERSRLGPVVLPDRTTGDQRRPRLTRFQVSPAAVDLLAGPATVQLGLAVNDDRPGLTARVLVFDSHGCELAAGDFLCLATAMECEINLSLPQVPTTGPSAEARVVVELTDAAGRTETYGVPGGAAWPDAAAATLRLASAVPDAFTRWAATWPGLAGLAADAVRDTDGDALPDVLEFALGTDPTRPAAGDPFAGRIPTFSFSGSTPLVVPGVAPSRIATWHFYPAPWFTHATDRYLVDDWELVVEHTADLSTWDFLPVPARDTTPGIVFANHHTDSVTLHQFPSATDSSRWYRANLRRTVP